MVIFVFIFGFIQFSVCKLLVFVSLPLLITEKFGILFL